MEKLPLNAPIELCQWFYGLIASPFANKDNDQLMYWMSLCYDTGRIDGINFDKKPTLKQLLLK
jgi:hypothetical protein